MKNHTITFLVMLLSSIVFLNQAHGIKLQDLSRDRFNRQSIVLLQAVPTALPTSQPEPSASVDERVLPPVGSNAGLVLGAAVLVLIIISGVIISSRWRGKH